MDKGYEKAIEVFGNGSKLANKLNITKANIYRWNRAIPIAWIKRVSDVTGIPMLELHPDTRLALAKHMDLYEAERARLRLLQLGAENIE